MKTHHVDPKHSLVNNIIIFQLELHLTKRTRWSNLKRFRFTIILLLECDGSTPGVIVCLPGTCQTHEILSSFTDKMIN